jgi:hypothetical protein
MTVVKLNSDDLNASITLFASAARAVAQAYTVEGDNVCWRGILIVVDVTAETGTALVTPSIEVKDENGDYNTTIWTAAAAIAATGHYGYLLYPGAIAADFDGTEAVGFGIPKEWQLSMTHADTDSLTYSVRGHYLL